MSKKKKIKKLKKQIRRMENEYEGLQGRHRDLWDDIIILVNKPDSIEAIRVQTKIKVRLMFRDSIMFGDRNIQTKGIFAQIVEHPVKGGKINSTTAARIKKRFDSMLHDCIPKKQ